MQDPDRSQFPFFTSFRVRYSEVDAQNVVYNAHYLTYFDIGLHEFYRASGLDYLQILADANADTRVVHASVNYLGAILFDALIDVAVCVEKLGRSSITYGIAIFRRGETEPKASGSIIWVVADNESGRSTDIPPKLRALLERFQAAASATT
jgi:acyl-CoA thioester hydrolase